MDLPVWDLAILSAASTASVPELVKNILSKSFGVIADNVQEVLPEIVSGEDTKSVNYNGLIGLLIEVVKDQQKQIDELRGLLDK